ncbi:MAG: hypothetical protein ABIK09_04620, partial [Pseudomonadota bacterium]
VQCPTHLPLLSLSVPDELREHGGDTVGKLMGSDDLLHGHNPINLHAVESYNQLLRFSERYLVGSGSGPAALAHSFL